MKTRRSAVFIIPNSIVGHELIFRHHTNKVVVGNYNHARAIKVSEQPKNLGEGKKAKD